MPGETALPPTAAGARAGISPAADNVSIVNLAREAGSTGLRHGMQFRVAGRLALA
jgi:hypothetical protein